MPHALNLLFMLCREPCHMEHTPVQLPPSSGNKHPAGRCTHLSEVHASVTFALGLQAGDVLILTKPLGVGVMTTALKKGILPAEGYEEVRLAAAAARAVLVIYSNWRHDTAVQRQLHLLLVWCGLVCTGSISGRKGGVQARREAAAVSSTTRLAMSSQAAQGAWSAWSACSVVPALPLQTHKECLQIHKDVAGSGPCLGATCCAATALAQAPSGGMRAAATTSLQHKSNTPKPPLKDFPLFFSASRVPWIPCAAMPTAAGLLVTPLSPAVGPSPSLTASSFIRLRHIPRIVQVLATMTQLNSVGEVLGGQQGVNAMTDVTGFGLCGHLLEVLRGSNLAATVHFDQVGGRGGG